MKTKYRFACLLLILCMTGCVFCTSSAEETPLSPMNREELFSVRDEKNDWMERDYTEISLQNESLQITEGGVYLLSGSIENGQITVNVPKDEKVQLVLNQVSVHSESHAALYILQADKVFITTAEGTENTLSSGAAFIQTDENNVDAALFSKDDITLNGEGTLTLLSPGGHGAVSKDEMTITGGTYLAETAGHGFAGQDNICISGGNFHITADKDGFHAEHDEDENLGFLYIENGEFDITAAQDGLSAAGAMEITGGSFTLLCGGGSEQAEPRQNEWGRGGFGQGNPFGSRGAPSDWNNRQGSQTPPERNTPTKDGGMPGFSGGFDNMNPSDTASDAAVSASRKGLKAGKSLLLSGGSFHIDSADDAIHSNGSAQINGGAYTLTTGDDGIHAEETLSINSGTITIEKSYEGLESLHLVIRGGDITLNADDDGLNAAGGTDQSGFGGGFGRGDRFGGRGFGGMSTGNGSITIIGGTLSVTASGDGIDANGSFRMDGGSVTVCGPTHGDTATLDYDTTAEINGGTFIGTGASGGMSQTFSGGTQGKIAVRVNNASAGTPITLTDTAGIPLLSHAPALDYQLIILSSPDILPGETYTLQVGSGNGTVTAR